MSSRSPSPDERSHNKKRRLQEAEDQVGGDDIEQETKRLKSEKEDVVEEAGDDDDEVDNDQEEGEGEEDDDEEEEENEDGDYSPVAGDAAVDSTKANKTSSGSDVGNKNPAVAHHSIPPPMMMNMSFPHPAAMFPAPGYFPPFAYAPPYASGSAAAGSVGGFFAPPTAPAAGAGAASSEQSPDDSEKPDEQDKSVTASTLPASSSSNTALPPPSFVPPFPMYPMYPMPYMMYPAAFRMPSPTAFASPFFSPATPPYSRGVPLALQCDADQLSDYQILVRQQLELFEATTADVKCNTQGRKKPVVLGQVGLRCRHCAALPLRARGRGAVYYPTKLDGIYQAAQNMAVSHLCQSCLQIPGGIKEELKKLRERRDNASGGKQYWADSCRAQLVIETENNGLRFHHPQQAESHDQQQHQPQLSPNSTG